MWWPESRSEGQRVQVQAADGQTWCGRLTDERQGTVGVQTDAGPVVVRLADVTAVRPAETCD